MGLLTALGRVRHPPPYIIKIVKANAAATTIPFATHRFMPHSASDRAVFLPRTEYGRSEAEIQDP
jgi:hypothetical protein